MTYNYKYKNTAKVIALPSQVSPSKSITARLLNGEITTKMYGQYGDELTLDSIDGDLKFIYDDTITIFPNTQNKADADEKHNSQEVIEDFVNYIVFQLNAEELHRLNACLIDVEFFMQNQQAFRNSTLAKSMLRAEVARYQASDEQAINQYLKPHVDRIEKNLLVCQADSMKKNRQLCLDNFLSFNLRMKKDVFGEVFKLKLAQVEKEIMAILKNVIKLEKPITLRLDANDPIDNAISSLAIDKEYQLNNENLQKFLKCCQLQNIAPQVFKQRALEIEQICREYTDLIARTSSVGLSSSSTEVEEDERVKEAKKEKSSIISDILMLISGVTAELAKTHATFAQTKLRMTKAGLVTDDVWTWSKIETLLKSTDEQEIYKELDIDTEQLAKLIADLNIFHKIVINQESILGKNQEQDKIKGQKYAVSRLFATPNQAQSSQAEPLSSQLFSLAKKLGF